MLCSKSFGILEMYFIFAFMFLECSTNSEVPGLFPL